MEPSESDRVVVPNRASRYFSIVLWLIWIFGTYGVVGTGAWPPLHLRDLLACFGVILLPLLALRTMRSRVVLDRSGLQSFREVRTDHVSWEQVAGFSVRGDLIPNRVGVDLRDGRWVLLQYHPYGQDFARQLEEGRREMTATR